MRQGLLRWLWADCARQCRQGQGIRRVLAPRLLVKFDGRMVFESVEVASASVTRKNFVDGHMQFRALSVGWCDAARHTAGGVRGWARHGATPLAPPVSLRSLSVRTSKEGPRLKLQPNLQVPIWRDPGGAPELQSGKKKRARRVRRDLPLAVPAESHDRRPAAGPAQWPGDRALRLGVGARAHRDVRGAALQPPAMSGPGGHRDVSGLGIGIGL
jgi:hypothetical protein